MTPDEEISYYDITDYAFDALLGRTLTVATLRLAVLAVVVCAVFAAVSEFAA